MLGGASRLGCFNVDSETSGISDFPGNYASFPVKNTSKVHSSGNSFQKFSCDKTVSGEVMIHP